MRTSATILEGLLLELPYFQSLRADERRRVAQRFRVVQLHKGQKLRVGAPDPPEMGLVIRGRVRVQAAEVSGLEPHTNVLRVGDRWGDLGLIAGVASRGPC
jgi:hypothetical protein